MVALPPFVGRSSRKQAKKQKKRQKLTLIRIWVDIFIMWTIYVPVFIEHSIGLPLIDVIGD